ncbi:type II toxin-antitoxin system Phd/YefM family antitoxin [uncultured Arthrobacter sp.]|uniref:type II toxin-antitoxin system Phd/YefM family antitoxin n=1 Tax=uncultured Arthrobacter sp. TaxID=114050 RepID=UPI00260AA018|nr:type II toxin-antitoxin system prevent-host-death family antitoxin [uncultured Arthrobacter sp.]
MTAHILKTVGVRELRQNASSILEEALRTGESVLITNHGRPMATLQPMTADLAWREELIAKGTLIPATNPGSLADIEPVKLPPGGPSMAEILEEMRADRS